MTQRVAGPNNGYIPSATAQAVAFARDPSEFKLNEYVQLVQHDEPVGIYTIIDRDEAVRVVSDEEFAWEDGADMPSGEAYKSRFDTDSFACKRRAYPWTMGDQAIKNASLWKPDLVHFRDAATKAMTNRTWQIVQFLENASNYPATNTAAANTLNGGRGKWDKASDDPTSPNFNAIASSILAGARVINLYTNGAVKLNQLRLVIGIDLAIAMSQSPELKNFVRQTDLARNLQTGDGMNMNALWGLPSHYQGVQIVVEDASRVSERPKAAGTHATGGRGYIKSSTSAQLVSRPGGLDGVYGAQSFSTLQCFYTGELLRVKKESDTWNEKVKGAVTEQFVPKMPAGVSGFNITAVM